MRGSGALMEETRGARADGEGVFGLVRQTAEGLTAAVSIGFPALRRAKPGCGQEAP